MTRDGLVNVNLSTGEETRASQRGQDFQLRQPTAPEIPRAADTPARDRQSIRQQLQANRPMPVDQGALPEDIPGIREHGRGPEDLPMEAARPTARSHEARSRENSAGGLRTAGATPRRKQAAIDKHNAAEAQNRAGEYESPPGTDITPYSEENPQNTHHNVTADTPIRSQSHGQPTEARQPGRLKFTEAQPQAPPTDAKNQRGSKYQQQHTPNAAKAPAAEPNPPSEKPNRLQFNPDELPPTPDKKLPKLQKQADSAAVKLEKARDKLPAKTRITAGRVYDEAKGKTKTRLRFEKEIIPLGAAPKPTPVAIVEESNRFSRREMANEIHQKITEVEKENVGVEAAHKLEKAAEDVYHTGRSVRSAYRFVKERPYRRVEKLEKRAAKTNSKLSYQKALNDNPKLKKGAAASRMAQKRKIKKEYAKAARVSAKKGAIMAKKAGAAIGKAVKAVAVFIKSNPTVFLIIAGALLIVFMFSSMLSSCSNMAISGLGAIFSSSYLAEDADIDDSEIIYTDWETDLRLEIENAEINRPGFDEYRYNVGDIGHDPHELIAYLTAKYQNFTFADVQSDLQSIFDEQYQLAFVEEIEIRTRPCTSSGCHGDDEDCEEEYEWRILNVTLTSKPFTDVVVPRLSDEEKEIYDLLMDIKGNRQYAASPFAFDWLPYVTSYYGWRIDPFTGVKAFHTGIDMGVPTGTEIIAAHDGEVYNTVYGSTGYGYQIVLNGNKGLQTRYAHLSEIHVSIGQEVKKGDVIGKTGNTGDSTGPHLHYEVIVNGNFLNPLYFSELSIN